MLPDPEKPSSRPGTSSVRGGKRRCAVNNPPAIGVETTDWAMALVGAESAGGAFTVASTGSVASAESLGVVGFSVGTGDGGDGATGAGAPAPPVPPDGVPGVPLPEGAGAGAGAGAGGGTAATTGTGTGAATGAGAGAAGGGTMVTVATIAVIWLAAAIGVRIPMGPATGPIGSM